MKKLVFIVLIFTMVVSFSACSKNTWTDKQKKALMLQQEQMVALYMSNYQGQKLNNEKADKLVEVTTCLVDLYTNKYNSYEDYFNQLPDNHFKNPSNRNKKKVLLDNLLKCNIDLSGMGYILMAKDGIPGYNIENIPEALKKQLRYDLEHK